MVRKRYSPLMFRLRLKVAVPRAPWREVWDHRLQVRSQTPLSAELVKALSLYWFSPEQSKSSVSECRVRQPVNDLKSSKEETPYVIGLFPYLFHKLCPRALILPDIQKLLIELLQRIQFQPHFQNRWVDLEVQSVKEKRPEHKGRLSSQTKSQDRAYSQSLQDDTAKPKQSYRKPGRQNWETRFNYSKCRSFAISVLRIASLLLT